jgi:catechol 2,3-dioxygenase-like lactoylglutathione lyase family enzyme
MGLALVLTLVLALAAPRAGTIDAPAVRVHAVRHAGMTVSDMSRALQLYTGFLPFTVEYDVEIAGRPWELLHGVFGARSRVVGLRLGDERLELTQYLTPRGRPMPQDSRANDQWFQHVAIIVRDMDAAYARLRHHDIDHASTAPQRLPDWNPGAGGIEAFYFRDPDGHFLEVLAFPADRGDPKWRRASEDVFLGIDHTAIVSTDTARSVAFYRDTLGLDVTDTGMGLELTLGATHVFVYQKDGHKPATFTVLNFEVADIDTAVDELVAAGITLERYEGMNQDDKGVARGKSANMGPDIAWFTDPAGNILSILNG